MDTRSRTCLLETVNGDCHESIQTNLPPEVEEGNIEYKLKLTTLSESRLEHLVTQMKWRLQEGQGEAIYAIGVEDNGILAGLTEDEMNRSLQTLENMASRLGASMTILHKKPVDQSKGEEGGVDDNNMNVKSEEVRTVAEVLIRKVPENQQFIDLRLAVLGNVDSGKSTVLGVLTHSELDNGRGRARLNLFRHLHEIQSGRTSSISHEILGFSSDGHVVNYSESRTVEEICESSTKLITLMDLCGHQKYLKTTIFGLTSYSPDFAMLVVGATTGIVGTTKEHLGLALALKVPTFVVVTKIDMCKQCQTLDRTLKQLERLLKGPGCRRVPLQISSVDDAITAATNFNSQQICPIFTLSCVTGENVDLLLKFLNALPPLRSHNEKQRIIQQPTEHQIDEMYQSSCVGYIAGGTLVSGTVREGDELLVGPSDEGLFSPVVVGSVHRNRLPCRFASAGQTACLSIGNFQTFPLRKGMVLVSAEMNPKACLEFEADIYVLFHSKVICAGFQTVVHIGNVRQTAIITKIQQKGGIKTNDKSTVRFRFINRPEYIRVGSRLLFREGRTKGLGEVSSIIPLIQEATGQGAEAPNR